jgi:microcin C transport system substrate-binding protein
MRVAGAWLLPLWLLALAPARAQVRTIISLDGAAAQLPPALPYANASAPKGGSLTLGAVQGFDSLNPFILRGTTPDTIFQLWQPLFKLSDTDSVTEYADLARGVAVEGNKITFFLDPRARFSDGTPVTAADVVWTFHTLITQGAPFYAAEYAAVASAAAPDAQTAVFTLKPGAGPDAAFNLAAMYILPAHFWAHRDFSSPLRDSPPGSGAYKIAAVQWGGSITYSHVQNWWAENLPTEKGFDNFGTATEDFFQDDAAALQAFKAGLLDARVEKSLPYWAAMRSSKQVRDGRIRQEVAPITLPMGIYGFVLNTRRPPFGDPRVREALALAFDFEWTNRVLLGGIGQRDTSYFSNSPMGAPSPLPVTDGSGFNLPQLRQALVLLNAAGWSVRNFQLVNGAGRQMRLEILLDSERNERIALPYAHNLTLLGIDAEIHLADPASYAQRLTLFDFDMTPDSVPESDYPGSEQEGYWGCAAARRPGSQNLAGVCSPAIDAAIATEEAAQTPAQKRAAIQALDRLLQAGAYMVPLFHPAGEWLEYWPGRAAKPAAPVQAGHDYALWWAK